MLPTTSGPYGTAFKPRKDFVQVSDKGVRHLEWRRDLEIECARQLAAGNRETQVHLGSDDVERLIAAYAKGNSVLQLAARFTF